MEWSRWLSDGVHSLYLSIVIYAAAQSSMVIIITIIIKSRHDDE